MTVFHVKTTAVGINLSIFCAKGRLKTQIQGFQTTFHLSPVSTPQILLKYRLILIQPRDRTS